MLSVIMLSFVAPFKILKGCDLYFGNLKGECLNKKCDFQGDQMFLLKNRQKTMKNSPKSRPTMFLLDLLYKTVLGVFCLILC